MIKVLITIILFVSIHLHGQESQNRFYFESTEFSSIEGEPNKYLEGEVNLLDSDSILMIQNVSIVINKFDNEKCNIPGFIKNLTGQKIIAEIDLYDKSLYVTNIDSLELKYETILYLFELCPSYDDQILLSDFLTHELSSAIFVFLKENINHDFTRDGFKLSYNLISNKPQKDIYKIEQSSKQDYCNYLYNCFLKKEESFAKYNDVQKKKEYDKLSYSQRKTISRQRYEALGDEFAKEQMAYRTSQLKLGLDYCLENTDNDKIELMKKNDTQGFRSFTIKRNLAPFPYLFAKNGKELKESISIFLK